MFFFERQNYELNYCFLALRDSLNRTQPKKSSLIQSNKIKYLKLAKYIQYVTSFQIA